MLARRASIFSIFGSIFGAFSALLLVFFTPYGPAPWPPKPTSSDRGAVWRVRKHLWREERLCDLCKRAAAYPKGGEEEDGSGQPVRCKDGFSCQKSRGPQLSVPFQPRRAPL